MYARMFSIIVVIASLTLASALAQVGSNLQPTQRPQCPNFVHAIQHRAWVRDLIVHLWKNMRHLPGRDGRVIIRFVLNRAGHTVSAKIEKSSGDAFLDNAALVMVRQADPVPLPPPCLTDQNLIVHVPLNFHSFPAPSPQ